ncbi:MAG: zinc ribbon domain-containing protein [Phycisphaerales bacterium]
MNDSAGDSQPAGDAPLAARPAPLPLAPGDEPCPNCGAPLPDATAVLCTQCGYDLAAAKARRTVLGRPIELSPEAAKAAEDARRSAAATPASRRIGERGDAASAGDPSVQGAHADEADVVTATTTIVPTRHPRTPLTIAGACAAVMVAAHLAGIGGLFVRVDGLFANAGGAYTEASPPWSERFAELGRWAVHIGLLCTTAFVGLLVVVRARRSRIGDLPTAAARVAAIVLAASLLRLLRFESRPLEGIAEVLGQSAVFVGLVILWFRLLASEAAQALAIAILGALGAMGVARLLVWAS